MVCQCNKEIKKQRIKEHSNEVGGSNLLVYPVVTRKLRHITTTERGLVNPYQKPQRLMMRLIEMFLNEADWIVGLFSGTGMYLHFRLKKYILIGCLIVVMILLCS